MPAVLFSGGLDSFILARLAAMRAITDPLTLVWVDYGQPYAEAESEAVDRLAPWIFGSELVRLSAPGMYQALMDHGAVRGEVVPSRNLWLACMASGFSGEVWMAALHGEEAGRNGDKSPAFIGAATAALTISCAYLRPSTVLRAPLMERGLTKAGAVEMALRGSLASLDELLLTTSCYESGGKCGECKTCYRRWEAFFLAGVDEGGYATPPWRSEYATREWPQRVMRAEAKGDTWDIPLAKLAEFERVRRMMAEKGMMR